MRINTGMATAIQEIRKSVLGISQVELAEIAQVSQGTVSRWEAGELAPSLAELSRIRAAALDRGKQWDDRWFFDGVPLQ